MSTNKKVGTSNWAIFTVIGCTLFTALGQLLWKFGVDSVGLSFLGLLLNWQLIGGFVLYGIGSVVLIWALKYGELSVLYPFLSLGYIWVAFLSFFFLGEFLSGINWIGMAFIILGVSLIGRGAS